MAKIEVTVSPIHHVLPPIHKDGVVRRVNQFLPLAKDWVAGNTITVECTGSESIYQLCKDFREACSTTKLVPFIKFEGYKFLAHLVEGVNKHHE